MEGSRPYKINIKKDDDDDDVSLSVKEWLSSR